MRIERVGGKFYQLNTSTLPPMLLHSLSFYPFIGIDLNLELAKEESDSKQSQIHFLIEVNLKACIQFNHVEVEEFFDDKFHEKYHRVNCTKEESPFGRAKVLLHESHHQRIFLQSNLVRIEREREKSTWRMEKRVHLHAHIGERESRRKFFEVNWNQICRALQKKLVGNSGMRYFL